MSRLRVILPVSALTGVALAVEKQQLSVPCDCHKKYCEMGNTARGPIIVLRVRLTRRLLLICFH